MSVNSALSECGIRASDPNSIALAFVIWIAILFKANEHDIRMFYAVSLECE